jgi:prepilin-type N-terminal cleavage/methylation domain-containing protein
MKAFQIESNQKGMTLIELLVGAVIAGLVILSGVNFLSSVQKNQLRNTLKNQASSEIQEFFNNRKKSIAQVPPSVNASLVTVVNATSSNLATVTIPRGTNNEIIEISCVDLPSGVLASDLPNNFSCPGVCNGDQIPVRISIKQRGNTTAGQMYPTNSNGGFPTGTFGTQMAASLCPQKNGTLLSLKLTYLINANPNANNVFDSVTRTEVFDLPVDNGIPKARVLGSSP